MSEVDDWKVVSRENIPVLKAGPVSTIRRDEVLAFQEMQGAIARWIDGGIVVPSLQLSGGIGDQGTFSWNPDEETADLILNGSTLQLGQEIHIHVRNDTGATIINGSPVMATGTLGASGRITVGLMDGSATANAKFFLGIVTEDIPDGDDGKVATFGKIRQIDTSGAAYGQTWSEGDILWISNTPVGYLTNVEPANTAIGMPVAIVINAHATTGTLMVRTTNIDEHYYINTSGGQDITGNFKVSGSSVILSNLPTTDPSVAGQLWNDSGTLKVS